jgi:diketogulonate reductase-like aldo/keto reductase
MATRSKTISRKDFIHQSALSLVGLSLAPYWELTDRADQIFRTIPSTGERLPVVGMGSWLTFDVGSSDAERAPMRRVLQAFVEAGGKVIDSSPMYGNSEQVIGQLAESLGITDQLWVSTKVWTSGQQAGLSQINDSVKLFGKWPWVIHVHNILDFKTHIKTLRKLKEEGRLKYIGVTHYLASAHEELARIIKSEPLDFIQVNLSVRETAAEDYLLPLATDKGLAVMINRPFESGALFRSVDGASLPPWAKEWGIVNWASFFLKYIIACPGVTCVIPATTQVVHARENMAAGYHPLPNAQTRKQMRDYFNTQAR